MKENEQEFYERKAREYHGRMQSKYLDAQIFLEPIYIHRESIAHTWQLCGNCKLCLERKMERDKT